MQRSCGGREHSTFKEIEDQCTQRAVVQNETGLLGRVRMFGLTSQFMELGDMMSIEVVDQIIIGWKEYFSIIEDNPASHSITSPSSLFVVHPRNSFPKIV